LHDSTACLTVNVLVHIGRITVSEKLYFPCFVRANRPFKVSTKMEQGRQGSQGKVELLLHYAKVKNISIFLLPEVSDLMLQ